MEQTQGDKEKARMLANPYNLVPERQPDWSHADQMDARYDEDLQVWTEPFMMASINTRVVRRSNALQNWQYGEDFRYNESTRSSSHMKAVAASTLFKVGMGAMSVPTIRQFLGGKLPSPGEGPSAEARENGFFKIKFVGKMSATEDSEPAITLIGEVGDNLDPGYGSTAKMLGQSALCLAFDDLPQLGGILTPASAMGIPLVNRLRKAGMTFKPET
jgi:short subunit dehydrogenase-like uncharacterized protein